MSVIEASSGTYRSRVDGTIVLSVEIEPRYRAEALALFGMPGTPMALAALKPQSSKPKAEVGELCKWAAIRCTEESFQRWVGIATGMGMPRTFTEAQAADHIRRLCNIASRTELDTNETAAAIFHREIRTPYAAWLKKQTVAA